MFSDYYYEYWGDTPNEPSEGFSVIEGSWEEDKLAKHLSAIGGYQIDIEKSEDEYGFTNTVVVIGSSMTNKKSKLNPKTASTVEDRLLDLFGSNREPPKPISLVRHTKEGKIKVSKKKKKRKGRGEDTIIGVNDLLDDNGDQHSTIITVDDLLDDTTTIDDVLESHTDTLILHL